MNNDYSILKDEEETKRFINTILQPLKNDEVYITVLTARKKYCNSISSSMEVINRDIIRSNDTDKILRKFRKMAIVENIYTDKENNIIPIEAFSLYVLPEPRSTLKGYKQFIKDINEWMYSDLIGEVKNLEYYRKIDTKLFSSIHKSKSCSTYFIIDIDRKEEYLLATVIANMKNVGVDKDSIRWTSETHGGYHIILDRNETTGAFIHSLHREGIKDVEFRKETMTPLPGSLQGGFLVKEYKTIMESG